MVPDALGAPARRSLPRRGRWTRPPRRGGRGAGRGGAAPPLSGRSRVKSSVGSMAVRCSGAGNLGVAAH